MYQKDEDRIMQGLIMDIISTWRTIWWTMTYCECIVNDTVIIQGKIHVTLYFKWALYTQCSFLHQMLVKSSQLLLSKLGCYSLVDNNDIHTRTTFLCNNQWSIETYFNVSSAVSRLPQEWHPLMLVAYVVRVGVSEWMTISVSHHQVAWWWEPRPRHGSVCSSPCLGSCCLLVSWYILPLLSTWLVCGFPFLIFLCPPSSSHSYFAVHDLWWLTC